MEIFPDYVYDQPARGGSELPMLIDGEWKYDAGSGRVIDRDKFEDFKTRFYTFEGYNPKNGYPTRATLEKMGMKRVADVMEKKGKLG
jgi:aldehyde:ferredoxin oxidoreductase